MFSFSFHLARPLSPAQATLAYSMAPDWTARFVRKA